VGQQVWGSSIKPCRKRGCGQVPRTKEVCRKGKREERDDTKGSSQQRKKKAGGGQRGKLTGPIRLMEWERGRKQPEGGICHTLVWASFWGEKGGNQRQKRSDFLGSVDKKKYVKQTGRLEKNRHQIRTGHKRGRKQVGRQRTLALRGERGEEYVKSEGERPTCQQGGGEKRGEVAGTKRQRLRKKMTVD